MNGGKLPGIDPDIVLGQLETFQLILKEKQSMSCQDLCLGIESEALLAFHEEIHSLDFKSTPNYY